MQAILRFPTGRRKPAVILAMDRDSMRVAVPHCNDVIELRSIEGEWIADSGKLIQVEAVIGSAEFVGGPVQRESCQVSSKKPAVAMWEDVLKKASFMYQRC